VTLVVGCNRGGGTTLSSCPPGATLMGAAPPKGEEQWCQKIVNGKPIKDGPFVVYATGGTRMIAGTYSDGKQTGEWTMWYENGERASVDHYKDGEQDGLHTSWYANGQKAIEGEYRDGKRIGVWTRWDLTGLRSEKLTYGDSGRSGR
jgi:antitoxin component YwqK of YwqJK toxin-antitoxin module